MVTRRTGILSAFVIACCIVISSYIAALSHMWTYGDRWETNVDLVSGGTDWEYPDKDREKNGSKLKQPNKEQSCQIPKLDPWDVDLLPHISHPRTFNCSHIQPDLTRLSDDGEILLTDVAHGHNSTGDLQCSLETLYNMAQNGYGYGPKRVLDRNTRKTFSPDSDTVQVVCRKGKSKARKKEIYMNTYNHPRKKIGRDILPNSLDQPSVLVWFLDGVSYSVLQRHLPSTYEYLTEVMGFRWLQGHVKVADNSFPNMIPFFTGLRAGFQGQGLPAEVERFRFQTYDDFDLIWKRYAAKGYATSYFEDWPHVGIFYMETGGFKSAQPTDHFYYAYNKVLEKSRFSSDSSRFCYGNEPKYAKALDTWRRLIRHYKGKRLFSIHMFTEMTHGYTSDLERADDSFKKFFKELFENGDFLNTVLVAVSDHGARYPPFRDKLVGRLENTLPMLGYFFPREFRLKYPHVDQALRMNKNRLTTHFDSHQTLLDILDQSLKQSTYSSSNQAEKQLKRGLSQLKPLPLRRSCQDASIPSQYCACSTYISMPINTSFAYNLSTFLVDHVNEQISAANLTKSCAKLKLKKILSSDKHSVDYGVSENTESTVVLFKVTVVTEPGDAKLEGTLELNRVNQMKSVTNTVDRINRYGNQSDCIHNAAMKLYCFCL